MDTPRCNGWASTARIDTPRLGTAPGTLYNYGPFPYANFTTPSMGRVTGQVMLMDTNTDIFERMNRIEQSSGYRPIVVDVTLDTGETIRAITYTADDETIEYLLPELPIIPDGDFNGIRRN